MDKQAIYNTVRDHLLSQGTRSRDDYGSCAYRGAEGLKCAVGALMTDEEAAACGEGWSVDGDLPFKNADPHLSRARRAFLERVGHQAFLAKLQVIHDGCAVSTWDLELKALAIEEGLDP